MPHLSGVFDEFPDLDKTPPEELLVWLKQKPETHFLVNFLGNRILYPQTIPLTRRELEIDLAVLRKGIKLKPSLVFQPQSNKIVIPRAFVDRFPPLTDLVMAIIEAISPKGIHLIFVKEKSQVEIVGSVIGPLNPQKMSNDEKTVPLLIGKLQKPLPLNKISLIRTSEKETKIILGGEEFKTQGGEAGIFVDLRLGGFG